MFRKFHDNEFCAIRQINIHESTMYHLPCYLNGNYIYIESYNPSIYLLPLEYL